MDEKTKAMIRGWLEMHRGDREGLARWMRDSLRMFSLREARDLIAKALS